MKRRQSTLPDGRYLIFYSFDDETSGRAAPPAEEVKPEGAKEPEAKPVAEEERHV